MSKTEHNVDLCVIGAGSGGLSVAAGAAMLGRSVVLYEAGKMGGDCLNYGCVPSKALIAAGKHAQYPRDGAPYGVEPVRKVNVDFEAVKAHIKGVIETIAPVDSQERFEGLGCIVIREHARFRDVRTVESETTEVRAKRFVVSTGSRASAPPIPGLADTPYLTNEDIFDVDVLPDRLLVIGAGPIGLELGQSFRRLGSEVEIFDIVAPLGRSEPEHAEVLVEQLKSEGIVFHAPAETKQISGDRDGVTIELGDGTKVEGSHLLVAAGRRPFMDGLELENAGVEHDRRGIKTDDCLRTSNKRVFAVGDVAAGMGGLTHAAGYHAGVIIKAFYFLPPIINRIAGKATTDRMPAAIYTEPELASIGMTEAQAREKHGNVRVVKWEFEENDRAIAERSTHGGVRIVATKGGKILGASVVGDGAGDIIQMMSVAMTNKVRISGLAQIISPYPTRGEAIKRASSSFYADTIFGPKAKAFAGFLSRFH
ncbi:MAG: FAD-dependent oxidoreductase [Hyphomonadaceae bacterium]|nr:FAD-dependent oxidoreductase [Hyphomonadaceae bacterium]MBC6411772.1 FAD-dependent oxidoreductase [Hyphomonadaceae bacterium]